MITTQCRAVPGLPYLWSELEKKKEKAVENHPADLHILDISHYRDDGANRKRTRAWLTNDGGGQSLEGWPWRPTCAGAGHRLSCQNCSSAAEQGNYHARSLHHSMSLRENINLQSKEHPHNIIILPLESLYLFAQARHVFCLNTPGFLLLLCSVRCSIRKDMWDVGSLRLENQGVGGSTGCGDEVGRSIGKIAKWVGGLEGQRGRLVNSRLGRSGKSNTKEDNRMVRPTGGLGDLRQSGFQTPLQLLQ